MNVSGVKCMIELVQYFSTGTQPFEILFHRTVYRSIVQVLPLKCYFRGLCTKVMYKFYHIRVTPEMSSSAIHVAMTTLLLWQHSSKCTIHVNMSPCQHLSSCIIHVSMATSVKPYVNDLSTNVCVVCPDCIHRCDVMWCDSLVLISWWHHISHITCPSALATGHPIGQWLWSE